MMVFCGGMIRSGSTLQFQIAYQMLTRRKICRRWTYLVPERLERKLRRLDGTQVSGLAKTHVLTPSAMKFLQQGKAKALYCFRDLRDVAVSGMRAFGYDWARFKADRLLEDAVTAEQVWRAQPGLLVQRYEQFMTDLPAAVTEIAQHLEIELEPREAARIARKLGLDRQKQRLKRWKAAFFASATHIHHGEVGSWRHQLSPAVADEITTKYSGWLTAHGYPLVDLPEESATSDESCYVPHVGWMTFERGDAVLTGLRDGAFEFAERAFLHRVLRPGDIFVDCGAHAGLYTRLCTPLVSPGGCIHALEPSPQTFARLLQNTADLPAGVVHVHQLALGPANKKVFFVAGEQGRSAYNHVAGPAETIGTINVTQQTIPAFWKQNGLRKVDFVKIDTEGQEFAILKAAAPLLRRGAIRALMVECSGENLARYGVSTEALMGLLKAHGYKLFVLNRNQFQLISADPTERESYANFFAVRNVRWLRQRFSAASPTARKISAEIVRRGAQVSIYRRRLLDNIAEQHSYIASLRTERDAMEKTVLETVTTTNRNNDELQKHIDSLVLNLDQLAATSRQQAEYIAILEKDRDRLTQLEQLVRNDLDRLLIESQRNVGALRSQLDDAITGGQKNIADLRSQLDQLGATSREQTGYIGILEIERDRLAGEMQKAQSEVEQLRGMPERNLVDLRAQFEKLAATAREQTEYISSLTKDRDRLVGEAQHLRHELDQLHREGRRDLGDLPAQREQLAATAREQAEFIDTLKRERDRLMAEGEAARDEAKRAGLVGQEHINALQAQLDQAAAANQQSIAALRAQLDQLAGTAHEQADYIVTLQNERDRLASETQQVRQDLERVRSDSQHDVDNLRSQLDQLAATAREQAEFIDTLKSERDRLASDGEVIREEVKRAALGGQKYIDTLRAQLERLAATSRQQTEYIGVLEKENKRLNSSMAQVSADCARYLETINKQTAYIQLLEQPLQPGA